MPPSQDSVEPSDSASHHLPADAELVAALRQGDERAFEALVKHYYASMLRIARMYVGSPQIAEEVIQETWIAVLRGIERFAARSALKTWIFSILMNKARTRARREDRYVPFAELEAADEALEPERFHEAGPSAGHWAIRPRRWDDLPESRLIAQETLDVIHSAIQSLSPNQRDVMTLRDLEHWPAEEVCNVLGLTETNQRVLLHRARSRVRRALEVYLNE